MKIIENNDKLKQNQNSFEITNVSYFEIRGAFGCGDYFRIDGDKHISVIWKRACIDKNDRRHHMQIVNKGKLNREDHTGIWIVSCDERSKIDFIKNFLMKKIDKYRDQVKPKER